MRELLVKNDEFKDSPLGKIPKDWDVKTLIEISSGGISNGYFKKPELVGSGYPLINVFDLYQDFGIDLSLVERVNADEKEQRKYAIQPGDCFFTRSSLVLSGIAHCNIIRNLPEAALFECHLMRVRPDKNQVIPEFLALWCRSSWAKTFFMGRAKQVTMTTISQPDIAPLPIPLPPLPEQQGIAEILDTDDRAIAQTSALITKLKQTKAGLLHDLLTRGLDENGQLRNPQTHPEQFKESAIGLIPKVWEVRLLSTVAEINSGVTLGRQISGLGTIELAYLRVANVQDGYLDLSEIKTIRVYKEEVPRFLLEQGDVLMNEGGDYDKLGRGTVWNGEISPCLHQNHVFRVRTNRNYLIPEYLALVSSSTYGKRFFILSSKQSTNLASINSTQLKSFPIACPSIFEQQRILHVFQAHDTRIRKEEAFLNKLKLQKQGLMQDLLTGKVRVKAMT